MLVDSEYSSTLAAYKSLYCDTLGSIRDLVVSKELDNIPGVSSVNLLLDGPAPDVCELDLPDFADDSPFDKIITGGTSPEDTAGSAAPSDVPSAIPSAMPSQISSVASVVEDSPSSAPSDYPSVVPSSWAELRESSVPDGYEVCGWSGGLDFDSMIEMEVVYLYKLQLESDAQLDRTIQLIESAIQEELLDSTCRDATDRHRNLARAHAVSPDPRDTPTGECKV